MDMPQASAFVELYRQQYPRIVAYARRRLGEMADAEDCASEVFRLAWQQPTVPAVGWLFVTAKNLVYAQYRASARSADLASRLATATCRQTSAWGSWPASTV